eukprot:TRINITY_DN11088_c0_g1_i1.p1 TRINITY_DN11088_c0_g1~~TRINITY_DN11088_c0_g1_i1.p1  ORF type:complete len:146 (-),score=36.65 TRINITY_DN11088_c0_g1_i1:149-586(-)
MSLSSGGDTYLLMSSGQTLGVKAQRFRGHTSPHRIQGIYPVAKKRSRIFGGEFEVGIEIKIQGANNKIKGVAVQIAKEKNYMQNYPHQLIGSSQRYFELLQCLGWGVIVVFYMHWDKFWYREQIMEDIGKLLEQDDNQLLVVQLE